MDMHSFSDFKYKLDYTPTKKSNCVAVSFTCDNQPIKRYIFVPKGEDVDYIKVAKKQIEKEINNGKLAKYVKKYNRKNKKPALITITSALGAAALAVGGVLIYKYVRGDFSGNYTPSPLTPEDIECEVADLPEGYSVNLSNLHSVEGKEYQTVITLATPINNDVSYYLPEIDKVKVYCNDELVQRFNYDLSEDALAADLAVPADEVKGKIKITLELATHKPIVYINIHASEESVGVDIPSQQIVSGEMSSFPVTINKNSDWDLSIPKIEFGETVLTFEGGDYTISQQVENEYFINLLGDPYTITDDIYITAIATEPTVRKIVFESNDLALYDEEHKLLPTTQLLEYDEEFEAYVGLKENASATDNVPLDLNIFGTKESTPLIFGEDYLYEFIDNNLAKLTIFAGSNDVTIKPVIEPDTTLASFIYHIPANSLDTSLEFEFYNESDSAIEVDWGDGSDPTIVVSTTKYYAYHTFVSDETDKDCVIKLKQSGETDIPERFGFNVYDDVIGYDEHEGYFSPDEPIASYCSGIENIVAAKINDNVFRGFTGEGLIHTNIRSLYIPDIQTKFMGNKFLKGGDGKYFSYCKNLNNFYIAEGNGAYKLAENNKLLLEHGTDGDANPIYKVISIIGEDEDGVTLDNVDGVPIVSMHSYASVGCKKITSLTLGERFTGYAVGAIIDCPNLSAINVDSNNSVFITGDNINMVATAFRNPAPDRVSDLYLVIRAKTSGAPFDYFVENFWPFCFTGSNTPAGMDYNSHHEGAPFYPYAFYRASNVNSMKIDHPIFWCNSGYLVDAFIYGCENLKKIESNEFSWRHRTYFPRTGFIQQCPNVESIVSGRDPNYCTVINNTMYVRNENNHTAIIAGTCTNSDIINEFQYGGSTYSVTDIATAAFNGNKVKNIYIPNGVAPKEGTYPFVGCDGSMFTSNSPYYGTHTYTDEKTGLPIESIIYTSTGRRTLLGVSLLNHNKTAVLPGGINFYVGDIGTYAFVGSSVTKISFEHGEGNVSPDFEYRSLYGANNIQELDFGILDVSYPGIPVCKGDMFDNDFYCSTVKVYVKDDTAKQAFSTATYWSKFAEYGNIIIKE